MRSEEVEHAIIQLNGTELNGSKLLVSEARERPQPAAHPGVPPSRLFVGNFPYETTEAELKELFSAVGLVSVVSLPVERESGRPRGFAFVEFPDSALALEAIRRFHNQSFKGRALAVTEARARENRPSASSPPRSSPPRAERSWAAPLDESPSRQERPRRHFGADAVPQRSRKQTKRRVHAERGQGKPLREKKGGQFFGLIEEESYDSTFSDEPLERDERLGE